MDRIVELAEKTQSSSVIVWRRGETLVEWHRGADHERTVITSVTKLVVGLGVALAFLDDVGVLDVSLAQRWLPEWRGDSRSAITLGHVLTHTSGLAAPPAAKVYAMSDIVQGAIEADVVSPPGRFAYNNLVINLAGEIVRRETGVAFHEWMGANVFGPLEIADWYWRCDAAGNPHCFADLVLRAPDLLKIGLLLNGSVSPGFAFPGEWRERFEPAPGDVGVTSFARYAWIRFELTAPLVDRWRRAGIPVELVDPVLPLIGRGLSREELHEELQALLPAGGYTRLLHLLNAHGLPIGQPSVGPRIGYGHDGDQGQHLDLLGGECVAVRLRAWEPEPPPQTAWPSFAADVWRALQPDGAV